MGNKNSCMNMQNNYLNYTGSRELRYCCAVSWCTWQRDEERKDGKDMKEVRMKGRLSKKE
jgi:hypothetical protein